MNRTCLFETLWFLSHGRPRAALRRLRGRWQKVPVAGLAGRQIAVNARYLSESQISRAFAPHFILERALALPLLLPPPYLTDLFRRHRGHFQRLERWERRLRGRWPWRHLGDHLALVLRRR